MEMHQHLSNEFKLRVFEESYSRIKNCLNRISEEELWYSPNSSSNSIGCLVKHLRGNAIQWILSGIFGTIDDRNRNAEFEKEPDLNKQDLLESMAVLKKEIELKLNDLTSEHLDKKYSIQGFDVTGFSAITHVIEHFSYHTGQIAILTKLICDEDLGFYSGLDLDQKN
jgi:uncharacterized damage-inducible protein DinB